ncbi:Uncharacterised protein [Vibrio cholerae]|nr:Uncharacterised protein [Vibrio cholerae]
MILVGLTYLSVSTLRVSLDSASSILKIAGSMDEPSIFALLIRRRL